MRDALLERGRLSTQTPGIGSRMRSRGCGALLLAFLALLAGCASGVPGPGGAAAVMGGVPLTDRQDDPPATAPEALDPGQHYLRADLGGRVAFLVLGEIDPHPHGPTEVWFGGAGEVLKLRQGRVVGTAGLPVDWRAVRFDREPGWPAVANTAAGARTEHLHRERDLMPGYRAGIRDRILRVAVPAPAGHALAGRAGPSGTPLRWFEERATTTPPTAALPPARYAVADTARGPEVRYTEQCLALDWCLRLERWTPPGPAAAPARGSAP